VKNASPQEKSEDKERHPQSQLELLLFVVGGVAFFPQNDFDRFIFGVSPWTTWGGREWLD
jgi:hypothetical protein